MSNPMAVSKFANWPYLSVSGVNTSLPEANIQRQPSHHVPVVLHIGVGFLGAVEGGVQRVAALHVGHLPGDQITEQIAGFHVVDPPIIR